MLQIKLSFLGIWMKLAETSTVCSNSNIRLCNILQICLTAYKRILSNYTQCWIPLSISICICRLCLPPPPCISLSLFLLGLLLALTHCNETQLLLKRKERVAVTALIKRLVLASRAEEALVSQRSCPIHHASHTPVQFYIQTHTGTHKQQSRQCSILCPDSTVH